MTNHHLTSSLLPESWVLGYLQKHIMIRWEGLHWSLAPPKGRWLSVRPYPADPVTALGTKGAHRMSRTELSVSPMNQSFFQYSSSQLCGKKSQKHPPLPASLLWTSLWFPGALRVFHPFSISASTLPIQPKLL